MRTIDIHAHITPEGFVRANKQGESWHGMASTAMDIHRNNPKTSWTPEERLADMNSLGVDVQVLSSSSRCSARWYRSSPVLVSTARRP